MYIILPVYARTRRTNECRFYTMTKEQECAHAVAVDKVATVQPERARLIVDVAVTKMLVGIEPSPTVAAQMGDVATAFRRLSDAEISALPLFGCPPGRITSLVLQVLVDHLPRLVRLDMDDDQADLFCDIVDELERQGEDRDEAWRFATMVVGRLLCGAPIDDLEAPFMLRALPLFMRMSADEVRALPLARPEDVTAWCTRR